MTALFLFAHQDDEIGVLHEISSTLARKEPLLCVYLTNGAWEGVAPERRNAESARVLAALGVATGSIRFLGTDVAIPDGGLVEHLDRCLDSLLQIVERLGDAPSRVVMHAWEGGHQDHDAGHLIGLAAAARTGALARSRQFPLYRPSKGWLKLAYASPLAANGPVERTRIPRAARLRHLALMRHYGSQRRVIADLLPHIVADYVLDGCQKLQPVALQRVTERPIDDTMLYERWKLYDYARFQQHAAPFISRRLSTERVQAHETRPSA